MPHSNGIHHRLKMFTFRFATVNKCVESDNFEMYSVAVEQLNVRVDWKLLPSLNRNNSTFQCAIANHSMVEASSAKWKGHKNALAFNSVSSAIKIKLARAHSTTIKWHKRDGKKNEEEIIVLTLPVIFAIVIFIKSHFFLHIHRFNAWLVHIGIFQNRRSLIMDVQVIVKIVVSSSIS